MGADETRATSFDMNTVFRYVVALALIAVVHSASIELENTTDLRISGCYWSGTAPICKGGCREGFTANATDLCGDGKCCNSGTKALCCPSIPVPTDCYWSGTAPICKGSCSMVGYYVAMNDRCGDGKCCNSGRKVLCCRQP